jgi:hypothetical protein
MKTSKKNIVSVMGCVVVFFVFSSCETAKQEPQQEPPAVISEKTEEPRAVPNPPAAVSKADEEYERSTRDLEVSVSKDTFEEDKKIILAIIHSLDTVMTEMDYEKWIDFLDPESVTYWSNRNNLQRASSLLPVKGLKLRNLYDYFKYVFIPSRTGRTVSEIRYISPDYVKAVQVNETEDIIYYYFVKLNGEWKVRLPEIQS